MTFIRYPHANCRLLIQESHTTGTLSSLSYRKGKRGSDKSRSHRSDVRIWKKTEQTGSDVRTQDLEQIGQNQGTYQDGGRTADKKGGQNTGPRADRK